MTKALSARQGAPVRAEDLVEKAAIEEVMYEYCDAFDEGRIEEVVALFTDDCRWDLGFGDVRIGREALSDFLTMRAALYSATTHHVSNIRIALSGDTARASSYVYARSWHLGTEFTSELWGRYRDIFEKRDGIWQIAERALRAAGSARFIVPEGKPAAFELIERRRPDTR